MRTETGGDGSQRIVVGGSRRRRSGAGAPPRRLHGQLEFIDPQGQQLTDGQDISQLIEDGTVGVLFDGGEIDIASVTPAVDGNIIGVQFSLSDSADQTWCQFTSANVDRPDRSRSTASHHHADDPGAICGGQTIITVGPQTPENEPSARALQHAPSARCRSLTEQGVETVDPTLGADFLARR